MISELSQGLSILPFFFKYSIEEDICFYRNIVESAAKCKDISRPVQESFRHTGHGSPFGPSWGSPACLRPLSPTDNSGSLRGTNDSSKFVNTLLIINNFTGRTLDSGLRKKKSSAEQYVRERKSNASKQFAYNKLKAEKHQTSSVLSKSKPSRPPQPKISNAEAEKEGMLIDLSPTTSGDHNLSSTLSSSGQQAMSQTASSLNVSLLDAPIDVPTEGSSLSFSANGSDCETKLEPPPYQSPPTYMNTLGMCQTMDNYAASTSFSNFQLPPCNSNHQTDPFNTSHIAPRYGSTVIERPQPSQHSPSKYTELGAIAKQLQLQQQKPMTNQLDALVLNTMASLSPRSSYKNLSTLVSIDAKSNNTNNLWNRAPSNIAPRLDDLMVAQGSGSPEDQQDDADNSLSESMKVNLSTLSIDDSINNSRSSAKKLDKAFYADLEKEIYKNESSAAALIVNTSQTYARQSANKENSVSTMPSEIYERRSIVNGGGAIGVDSGAINLNKVQNASPRPIKYANAMPKSINQEIAQRNSNYETSSGINLMQQQTVNGSAAAASLKNFAQVPYQIQKQNNTENSGVATVAIDTASVINQIWFEQQSSTAVAKESPRKPTIGQYGLLPQLSATPEKNHNFVAISNRPSSMLQNDTRPNNIYSSVAGDIYGSIAGDIYETIQPPPSMLQSLTASTPEIYTSIPRNSVVYGNTMPSMAPVLYDEVAGEEQLRPHRPAPVVPGLSAQQIQRRMERERQQMQQQQVYGNIPESQKVAALMHEIGDEATQGEAVQALQTANWDHATAVRHFKIERLVR